MLRRLAAKALLGVHRRQDPGRAGSPPWQSAHDSPCAAWRSCFIASTGAPSSSGSAAWHATHEFVVSSADAVRGATGRQEQRRGPTRAPSSSSSAAPWPRSQYGFKYARCVIVDMKTMIATPMTREQRARFARARRVGRGTARERRTAPPKPNARSPPPPLDAEDRCRKVLQRLRDEGEVPLGPDAGRRRGERIRLRRPAPTAETCTAPAARRGRRATGSRRAG